MIARIIRKALEILNGKTGIEWEKGCMGHFDVKFDSMSIPSMFGVPTTSLGNIKSVCTLGALELAARFEGGDASDYRKAAAFVATVGAADVEVFKQRSCMCVSDLEYMDDEMLLDTIPEFNDNPDTTQNEVLTLLRAALVKAEALPLTPLEPVLA